MTSPIAGTKTGWITAGLLLAILMSSMDNTIVATAMGTIVGKLGGLDHFVWVTSAYIVTEMAGMPIFGKLSDMYGRKRLFTIGMIFFLVGSALCGTAQSIVQLSLYRAVQGIGAGALVPIAFTILLDAVPPENRGKLLALFGATYGISSLFGPLLGAFLTDTFSWRWIFFVNLPLGIAALFLTNRNYKESINRSKQPIDWQGTATLVGSVVCLVFALELGGKLFAWNSPIILGLLAGFAALGGLFVLAERRALEPIVSFSMFRDRIYASSALIALLSGAAFIAATVYLPIYIQGVLGGSATYSGFMLLPMMIGTVASAAIGGFVMDRTSYRSILVTTLALLVLGLGLLATISPNSPPPLVTFYMIFVGIGIGASFSVLANAAIHSVSPANRGAATATINFLRAFGMMLGITLFGILQNQLMNRKLSAIFQANGDAVAAIPPGLNLTDPHALMEPTARSAIPGGVLELLQNGVSASITEIFLWGLLPAVLALAAAFAMGRAKHDPKAEADVYGH
ncbi:MDR family MFS transporter [Paenibacillus sp. NPDC058071]|uniref:MDR family MFS transporter n=1 Tax=Paenibacillus sp. NPDC058071 TaxID=3346326 RepID=UPI0036DD2658